MPSNKTMYLHCTGCDARWLTADDRAATPCPCDLTAVDQRMTVGPYDALRARSWVCSCNRRVWPGDSGVSRVSCPYCGRRNPIAPAPRSPLLVQ